MKRALLSVWDKTGIADLARALESNNIELLSSGGTGAVLRDAGINFEEVAAYTGSPEMMDGRVKTLHPRIHGGLLGRRGLDDEEMKKNDILPIDLLVVNLYPFEEMAGRDLSLSRLMEYVDIGGPAMIRAGAKNFMDVTVVTDPEDYPMIISSLKKGGPDEKERRNLAQKAFARTAGYDAAISNYLYGLENVFAPVYTLQFSNGRELRYGENPHQSAAVYGTEGIAGQIPLQGRQMSYNNYLDADAATGLVREFEETCAVFVKHNNPCGVAVGKDLHEAYVEAREVDSLSAYGAVVALNRPVDLSVAEEIISTFVEVVIAPGYENDAREILRKKENMRVLLMPERKSDEAIRTIDGGVLVQRTPEKGPDNWQVVTERKPDESELRAMKFALKVCAHTKSNTIILADERRTLGIGAGQVSRVDAAKIAVSKAHESLKGAAVASDAFLPFPDALEVTAEAGAMALIQPGGSIRDAEVIDAANRLGVAMVFTGERHFRH